MKTIQLTANCDSERVDKYLSEQLPEFSRAHLQKLILEGQVFVNGKPVKSNHKLKPGNEIHIEIPEPKSLDVPAEEIELHIVYEDKDLLIVNKPQGMVVHPAPGHSGGTLVNAILHHCRADLSGINGVTRPGIVHRIDKNTSGLLLVCKNDFAHVHLAKQLKDHSITRKYEAIAYGSFTTDTGTVNAPIGRNEVHRKQMAINYKNGKEAITHYKVLESFRQFTHVELQLETGRTHQIRVHLASIKHPILGDDVYGPKKSPYKLEGQVLHARTLGFIHPTTEEYMEFNSELPEYFYKLLQQLRVSS